MKTIGLIGGMSWESTAVYYRLLNEMARERLGGLHSAELVLYSVDFAPIEAMQATGDWDAATKKLAAVARQVEAGGAACLLICTNTMHKMADAVQAAVSIPLIHIADATAAEIKAAGVSRPLLLATRYTMEEEFYKGRLRDRHGLDVIVPGEAGRTTVHDIIYRELCVGTIRPESKAAYLAVIDDMRECGADAVLFGCTEVGLLLRPEDLELPSFDTTGLHCRAAMDFALAGEVE